MMSESERLKKLVEEALASGDSVLMMVQYIRAGMGNPQGFLQIIAFTDLGSSCSLITLSLAAQLNLLGRDITITLHTVNRAKELLTKLYMLSMETRSSNTE